MKLAHSHSYLDLVVTVIKHGTTLHFHRHQFWSFSLLFGFYIYSADLQAKQAHQFTPPPPPPPCLPPPRLPLLSLPSGGLAFVMCVIVTPSAPVFVLRRETSESSWITVWTTAATAASTAAAATATAAATTSLWGASTRGRTTTKEAGSSVRLSCRATGGSPACWGGSEEAWCRLGFNLFLSVTVQKILPLINNPDLLWDQSRQLLTDLKVGPSRFSQS